jgi:hypothetical protein
VNGGEELALCASGKLPISGTGRDCLGEFGRTFSSGIESPLPRPMPSPLALLSMPASASDAMTAARSISISRQNCGDTSRSFRTLSLPIRYFEITRGMVEQTTLLSCRGTRTVPKSISPNSMFSRDALRFAFDCPVHEKFLRHVQSVWGQLPKNATDSCHKKINV